MTTDNGILTKFIASELSPSEMNEAMFPQRKEASLLLVACDPVDYSASAIAKAVEDCDAHLLALSVTAMTDAGRTVVALSVNVRHGEGVARSLARYGYDTLFILNADADTEQRRAIERVNELIHYLEI